MKLGINVAHTKLLLIGVVALTVTTISAATMFSMALFTDNATVDNNTFTTGTIVLTTTNTTALFNVGAMMPGDSVYGQLNVANGGTGQLRYAMTSSSTDDSQHLADQVTLEIRQKAAGTCATDFNVSASKNLCFKASLPGATDHSYQGATTTTTFTFYAEQTANN